MRLFVSFDFRALENLTRCFVSSRLDFTTQALKSAHGSLGLPPEHGYFFDPLSGVLGINPLPWCFFSFLWAFIFLHIVLSPWRPSNVHLRTLVLLPCACFYVQCFMWGSKVCPLPLRFNHSQGFLGSPHPIYFFNLFSQRGFLGSPHPLFFF